MKTHRHCSFFIVSLAVGLASAASEEQAREFHLDLLPKPFQRNPELEMTVFSEVTDFGRTLPAASPDHPIYFVAHESADLSMGASAAHEKIPPLEELDKVLHDALAKEGFLPAPEGVQPSLILMFHWGSHNHLDFEIASKFPELNRRHVLERAMLVGGSGYRRKIEQQMDGGEILGNRTTRESQLYYQTTADLYYAIVSAYEIGPGPVTRPRLAWRTTMTVNAVGVSMHDALPPLLITASDFLGKDMKESSLITRNVRRGTVKMGPLTVIGDVPDSEMEGKK